jgi:hypothetical protein
MLDNLMIVSLMETALLELLFVKERIESDVVTRNHSFTSRFKKVEAFTIILLQLINAYGKFSIVCKKNTEVKT